MAGERKPYIGDEARKNFHDYYSNLTESIARGQAIEWNGFDNMWTRWLGETYGTDSWKYQLGTADLEMNRNKNNELKAQARQQYLYDLKNALEHQPLSVQAQHALAVNIMQRFRSKNYAEHVLAEAHSLINDVTGENVSDFTKFKSREIAKKNLSVVQGIIRDMKFVNPNPILSTDLGTASALVEVSDPRRHVEKLVQRWNWKNNPFRSPANTKNKLDLEVAQSLVNTLNSTNVTPLTDDIIKIAGGEIWKSFRPGSTANPYDKNFAVNSQQALETFERFRELRPDFVAFDIETMGHTDIDVASKTPGHFLHVTEIGMSAFSYVDGKYQKVGEDGLLLRPNRDVTDYWRGLIDQLESNHGFIHHLDEATQRALFDLTRYDNQAEFIARQEGPFTGKAQTVIHSNTYAGLFTESKLTNPNAFLAEMKKSTRYTNSMRQGLDNMIRHGVDAAAGLTHWNNAVNDLNTGGAFFVSQNGLKFDAPVLNKFAATMSMEAAGIANHLDTYALLQTVYNDPIHMLGHFQDKLNPTGGGTFNPQYGPLSLDQFRTMMGWGLSKGHAGLYDTGEYGAGGMFAEIMDIVGSDVDAAIKGEGDGIVRVDKSPIRRGDVFFSPNGLTNAEGFFDIQVEGSKKGEFKLMTGDWNRQALNADTFYTVGNVFRLDKEKNQYALQLIDEYNEKNVFLVREGERAREEIAEVMQRHMISWDVASQRERALMETRNLLDKTARRYSGLFGLIQSKTRGYEAARRMYDNAAIWEAAQNRRRKHDVTEKEFLKMAGVNFDTLYDGKDEHGNAKYIFNQREFNEFWQMRERLASELPIVSQAFGEIDGTFGSTDGLGKDEALKVNQQKSLALQRSMNYINDGIGHHKLRYTGDELLDHEKRNVEFVDALGDKARINFHSMEAASASIRSYLYRGMDDSTKDNQLLKDRHANERLGMLVDGIKSVTDTQFGKRLDTLIDEHVDLGLSKPTVVTQQIAEAFYTSDIAQSEVFVENMSKARMFTNTDLETAKGLVSLAVKEASGIPGYVTETNNKLVAMVTSGGELDTILSHLDNNTTTSRKVAGLSANNRAAVEALITRAIQVPGFSVATSITSDQALLNVYLYQHDREVGVLGALNEGRTPNGALKMTLPLIQQNGNMLVGNQMLNARMYYIRDESIDANRMISSVEKMSLAYQNILRSKPFDEYVTNGEWDNAQSLIDWRFRKEKEEFSGFKRNLGGSDTLEWRNNLSDLLKQGEKQISPALIHELYERGILQREGGKNRDGVKTPSSFRDPSSSFYTRTVEVDDGKGNITKTEKHFLNRFVTIDDLSTDAQDLVRQMLPDWVDREVAAGRLPERLHFSGSKSTRAQSGMMSSIDTRDLFFMGSLTDHKRDNPVQAMNSYLFSAEEQAALSKHAHDAGLYMSFDNMAAPALLREILSETEVYADPITGEQKQIRDYKMRAHVKAVYMNPIEVEERLQQMLTDPNDRDLLIREGILRINDDGTDYIDPIRRPTTYEQQAIMATEVIENNKMKLPKFYNLDDIIINDKVVPTYVKSKPIEYGDIIGWDRDTREPIVWRSKNLATIQYTQDARRLAVIFEEQAHKYYLDMEKVTPGGGINPNKDSKYYRKRGYSAEFIERLTGVEGASVAYATDVKKHFDFASFFGGDMNLVLEQMNKHLAAGNTEKIEEITNAIEGSELGLTVIKEESGRYGISDESSSVYKGAPVTPDIIRDVDNRVAGILATAGVSNVSERGYRYGIQPMNTAQITDWSRTVGEDGEVFGRETGVRYGVRELDVVRSKGGVEVLDYLMDGILERADAYRVAEAKGIYQGIQSFAGQEISGAPVLGVSDFTPLPTSNRISRAGYSGTILDHNAVSKLTSYDPATSSAHGFYFQLPTEAEDGTKLRFVIDEGDSTKEINRVFLPHMKLEGKGAEVYPNEMQKAIRSLYEASEKLTRHRELGGGTKIQELQLEAQGAINRILGGYAEHGTSARGRVFDSVLKAQLPNSASGLTKIISPAEPNEFLDNILYLNRRNAEAIGVANIIDRGEEAYALSSRYPTFHEGAVNVVKVRILESAADNEQYITMNLASLEEADADGDSNHAVGLVANKKYSQQALQSNLSQMYEHQQNELMRGFVTGLESGDPNAILKAMEIRREQDMADYQGKWNMDFTVSGILDAIKAKNESFALKPNSSEEVMAKTGKAYVGLASDLNSQMKKIIGEYHQNLTSLGKSAEAAAVEKLGYGIEQKLTIASKHGGQATGATIADSYDPKYIRTIDGKDYLTAPAVKFTSALSSALKGEEGAWDRVMSIDKDLLGGRFTKDFQLGEARSALEPILSTIGGKHTQANRLGLGSGIRLGKFMDMSKLSGLIFGTSNSALNNDMSRSLINRLMNQEWIEPTVKSIGPTRQSGTFRDSGSGSYRIPSSKLNAENVIQQTPWQDWGLPKVMGNLSDAMGGKGGIIGAGAALAVTGLSLATLTRSDSISPESRPHASGNHDNATAAAMQQTPVRVQEGAGQSMQGMGVRISGRAQGDMNNQQIGSLAGDAFSSAGIPANVNVRSQDDTSTINRDWLSSQFATLVTDGYVGNR